MSDDPWGTTPDPWAQQAATPSYQAGEYHAEDRVVAVAPVEGYNHSYAAPPVTVVNSGGVRPVSNDNDKISVTLKGGTGYDAPWIVVKGTSVQEALDTLNEIREKGLMDVTAKAAGMFQGYVGGASHAAGAGASQGTGQQGGGYSQRPPAQPSGPPPGVEARNCRHGQMVYRTGMSKFNKPYQAFFCPQPKESHDKCEGIFF